MRKTATKLSQVYAKHLGARISPKKLAPVADLVRGKNIQDAKVTLTFDPTKASQLILKVLKSAEANALHNNKMSNALFVSELWVGPGETMKRGRLVAKSRFNPIMKRTANIYVGLSEVPYDNTPAPIKAATAKSEKSKTVKKENKVASNSDKKVKRAKAPKKESAK